MLIRLSLSLREYVASDGKSSVITPSFRFYFHFLHSELTEFKTFTCITLAQSLHVAYVKSTGSHSWFKTEIFPTLQSKQLPPPHIYIYICICVYVCISAVIFSSSRLHSDLTYCRSVSAFMACKSQTSPIKDLTDSSAGLL